MHQTFYIDIDEEITSIVDRIRKSKADEIVIVVPKRALLIQSIVNLKLLKKEAEGLKRQIMIVTQDKLGKLLIEKAGILVQQKLDEGLEDVLVFEDENKETEKTEMEGKKRKVKNEKLRELGTSDYFSENSFKDQAIMLAEKNTKEKKNDFENITNKELVTSISHEIRRKKGFFGKRKEKLISLDMVKNVKIKGENHSPENEIDDKSQAIMRSVKFSRSKKEEKVSKKLERFFSNDQQEKQSPVIPKNNFQKINVSKKFKKIFLSFGALAVVAVLSASGYLFLPKASINIYVKSKMTVEDNEIKGDKKISQIDFEKEAIPAIEISAEEEISQNFSSSGEKSISNQKAKGKITIYNEYSSTPQSLVATTRFLSEGGKLFRLSAGVIVPGTEKVGGEFKPGMIEADVVADEPGEDFNISPSIFTIPGFKDSGSEKYSKFYAKSTSTMTGGGKGNEEIKVITQSDVDNAKNKVLADLNSKLKEKLKQKAEIGTILLDEAISYEGAEYLISNSVGEISGNFSLTVKSKAKILVVKEEDLKSLISKKSSKNRKAENMENGPMSLEFGKTDVDFNAGEVIMRVHSTEKLSPKMDLDNLKKGILGKNEEQLKDYLNSYPDIEKIVVDYWPPFITGKIPMYEKRVKISLDNI